MSSRDNFRQAARELFGLESKKNKEGDAPPSIEGFLSELPPEEPVETDDIAASIHAAAEGEAAPAAQSYEPEYEPQAYDEPQEFEPEPAPQPEPASRSGAPGASAVAHGYSSPQRGYAEYSQPAAPAQNTHYVPPEPQYAPPQYSAPPQQAATPVAPQTQEYAIVDSRRETSIIAKGTTIVGRVRTDGHIEVMGRVEGNIDAEGNVAVSGRVAGNIKGQHLELLSCQVKGNLHAGAGAFVNSETVIVGDVTAENIIFDGRIKGNIEAAQSAEFNRNSYIVGDISAKTIAIEPGAVINGMIRTVNDQFDTDDFDELGRF